MFTPPHFAQLRSEGVPADAVERVVRTIDRAKTHIGTLGGCFAQAIALRATNVDALYTAHTATIAQGTPATLTVAERRAVHNALLGIYLFVGTNSVLIENGTSPMPRLYDVFRAAAEGQQCLTEALHLLPTAAHACIFNATPTLVGPKQAQSKDEWRKYCRGALAAAHVAASLVACHGRCYLPETQLDQESATDILYLTGGVLYAIQVKVAIRSFVETVTAERCSSASTAKQQRQLRALRDGAHAMEQKHQIPCIPLLIGVELAENGGATPTCDDRHLAFMISHHLYALTHAAPTSGTIR